VGGLQRLETSAMCILVYAIYHFTQLQLLDIAEGKLGDDKAEVLATGLQAMPELRSLCLRRDMDGAGVEEGMLVKVLPAVGALMQLRMLCLAKTGATVRAVRALCDACTGRQHSLAALDVLHHELGGEAAECAQLIAAVFPELQKVCIWHDEASAEQEAQISSALERVWGCTAVVAAETSPTWHCRDGVQRMLADRSCLPTVRWRNCEGLCEVCSAAS
jgi:hypothetical protein